MKHKTLDRIAETLKTEGFTPEQCLKVIEVIKSIVNRNLGKRKNDIKRKYRVGYKIKEQKDKEYTIHKFEEVTAITGNKAKEYIKNKYPDCRVTSSTLIVEY